MSMTTVPRRKHTQLQPLATSHDSIKGYARSGFSTPSSVLLNTSTLPSPSIIAARAYFQEQSPPIGQKSNALQRRRSLIEGQEFPRRHSALPTPGSLAAKIAKFTLPDRNHRLVQHTAESESNTKVEQTEDVSMTDVVQEDQVKLTAVTTGERKDASSAPISDFLQKVPFQYTHDRLRDWGYAYLGNSATADAFINPVNLRRPSLQLVKDDISGDRLDQPGMVTIRARVLPKARERKPFVLQRKFDIEGLRASIPTKQLPASIPLRRSSRARRSSVQVESTKRRSRTPESLSANRALLGKGRVPIHIEYALHFLPVLAALLLSGHVRKGDSVDLPVPYPEAWRDMISYVYTGKGEITTGVKENILFLAGNAG
ncbi:hypothetical protein D0Z07_1980 [Hyphodiscus hymeniophilus]|uniref:BTB domain-containing protein n=1 Tax=Hyphodiscus hymeniophilus TaxID=353542 RepID=A0A9P6VNI1_9HELO|nr:hypothetical protein D0Z07_1980 [Hyphodiscus hymeniophilus]